LSTRIHRRQSQPARLTRDGTRLWRISSTKVLTLR
jgi:hypothetical protein